LKEHKAIRAEKAYLKFILLGEFLFQSTNILRAAMHPSGKFSDRKENRMNKQGSTA